MTLANLYRPKDFSDVVEQEVVCRILSRQIETNSYKHALLFAGSAGSGKTTCARIFASKIDGEIFEIDCASHNGVADVKDIVENARIPSLTNTYKVFILDECHTFTTQAWSSLLITLEEDLPNSIFIFCTTDIQKIPNTIISRVQEFNFIPITEDNIFNRLKFICNKENISIDDEGLKIIAKVSEGNLRQALTNLDKCILYNDLSNEAICRVLNIVAIDTMNNLMTAYNNSNIQEIANIINSIYSNGYELHNFIRQFLDFSLNNTNIKLTNCILKIINDIRYDDSPKNLIIANLICS